MIALGKGLESAFILAEARYCPGIATFVAPAEAGVQAYARMARRIFAWIPAYAGTTMLLSLAKLKARGCSRFFAPIVVFFSSSASVFTYLAFELRQDLEQVAYEPDIRDFENRCLRILVDRDDRACVFDAGEVLDRT